MTISPLGRKVFNYVTDAILLCRKYGKIKHLEEIAEKLFHLDVSCGLPYEDAMEKLSDQQKELNLGTYDMLFILNSMLRRITEHKLKSGIGEIGLENLQTMNVKIISNFIDKNFSTNKSDS